MTPDTDAERMAEISFPSPGLEIDRPRDVGPPPSS
jgi:hypothetical protein